MTDKYDIIMIVVIITTIVFSGGIFVYDYISWQNQQISGLQAANTQLNKQVCTLKEDANVVNYTTCLRNSERDNVHCYNVTYVDTAFSKEWNADWDLCPETNRCITGFGVRSEEYSGTCDTRYVVYYKES